MVAGKRERQKGSVKWYNASKGFGFITTDEEGREVFVHFMDIRMDGFKRLEEGQRVIFDITPTERGLQAINVTPL
jgi:CspA family cold shock protein